MKYLLMLLILALVLSGLTGIEMSLAPGLSVKNLFLYLAAALLFVRAVVLRNVRFELAGVTFAFSLLFAYATASWIVSGVVLQYEGYSLFGSAMPLKSSLLDYLFIFWVFFYGLTRTEAVNVLSFLLAIFGVGHVLGLLSQFGYVDLPGLYNPYDDRLRGFVGEVNQYGTLIACFLPPTLVQIITARTSIARLFWLMISLVSLAALLLSGSRGATLGLLIGAFVMVAFYRKTLPIRKLVVGGVLASALAAVVVLLLGLTTGDYLFDRFIGDSKAIGLGNITSGRSEIWLSMLRLMADSPVTFITGFGWNTYFSLPFRMAPHNTFLLYWFELGLIGVGVLCWLLWKCVALLRSGAKGSTGPTQALLMSISVGVTAAVVSAFFVELPIFWPYFWMLAGAGLRIALDVGAVDSTPDASTDQRGGEEFLRPQPRDAFGWHHQAQRNT